MREVALSHEPIVHALEDVGHVVDGVLELRLSITELHLPIEELLLLVEDLLQGVGSWRHRAEVHGTTRLHERGRVEEELDGRRAQHRWTVLVATNCPNLDGETCGVGQQDGRHGVRHEQVVLVAHSRDHLHGLTSGEVHPIPTLDFLVTLQRKTGMQGDGSNDSPKYYCA
ncbi:hypothetical protein Salat_1141600 [Sesamum alatum]|uniref:Uncharacterized protein n=1 Tax=Sesamum alatum TaxID=300844 RepID=A0AAE2CN96_9LAMI|nr:hypothetical protein Salat_1141600 [Sesamum alatum]